MRNVRVWFEKHAKYISHLDLNRYMLRAVRRARLPVWMTEGFNPHPYIRFALPLSLGFESEKDCFDIRITKDLSNQEICAALQAVLSPEIWVTEVTDPVYAFKEIQYAQFKMRFESKQNIDRLQTFFHSEQILVERMSKKAKKKSTPGELINLKEFLRKVHFEKMDDHTANVPVILPAGNDKNINPQLLVAAAQNVLGDGIYCKSVLRTMLLLDNLEMFC